MRHRVSRFPTHHRSGSEGISLFKIPTELFPSRKVFWGLDKEDDGGLWEGRRTDRVLTPTAD